MQSPRDHLLVLFARQGKCYARVGKWSRAAGGALVESSSLPSGGSANPGWTRPCRKEEEGQGKRRATPDICGARAKLQDTKTRAPPIAGGG